MTMTWLFCRVECLDLRTLRDDQDPNALAKVQVEDKWIAATCAAPITASKKAGVLENKKIHLL